jgi:hypothetical protein
MKLLSPKRIKSYLDSTQGQERLSHLSLFSVEKALVADLKKKKPISTIRSMRRSQQWIGQQRSLSSNQ